MEVAALRRGEELDRDDVARRCAAIARSRRAPCVAIETWSSWLAEVGIESTLGRIGALLVLGDERRRRHLRDHEAGVEPRPRRQEGRQARTAPGRPAWRSRRSASEPISHSASAIMSAAKATGSAWKLPPEITSPVVGEDERVVGDAVRLRLERRGGLAQEVEAGAHHLRLAAQAIRVLDAVVVGEMRGADGAAAHQVAKRRRDLDLAAVAAQRLDARVERPVRAARRVGRERAGDERRLEHALGLEQAGERERGRDLRAVEEREALLRTELDRREAGARRAPRAPAAARRRRRHSPSPMSAAARCASGARSPDAPTEPCAGTTGTSAALEAGERDASASPSARRRRPGRGWRA